MRTGGIAVSFVLVVGACGGGDDGASPTDAPPAATDASVATDVADDTTSESPDTTPGTGPPARGESDWPELAAFRPEAQAIGVALVDAHGPEGGFTALVHALENGYDIDQIAAASAAGNLGVDGTITDDDGSIEPPSGPALGVIQLVSEADGFRSRAQHVANPDDNIRRRREARELWGDYIGFGLRPGAAPDGALAVDFGYRTVAAIAELAYSGYSLEQIVDFIVLERTWRFDPAVEDRSCGLLTSGGEVVQPADRSRYDELCFTSESPIPTLDDAPTPTDGPATTEPAGGDGDLDAWCEQYGTYARTLFERFEVWVSKSLGAEPDADSYRDGMIAELDGYLTALAPLAPGEVRAASEGLAATGLTGLTSSEGLGAEREGWYLALDEFAAANCDVSLAGLGGD